MRNNGGSDSSTPEVYAEDIEAEVNTYFQQMFSAEMTVEAVVDMLARFKESPERRFIFYWVLLIPFFFFFLCDSNL